MRVEWSNPARDDLDDIERYISRDSGYYARAFIERILHVTRRLGDFPESGRLAPEDDTQLTREMNGTELSRKAQKTYLFRSC